MAMMDEWFDQYVYEVVVRKEYLSQELLKILETEPVVLSFWDPLCGLSVALRR
jgi:bleomycin hydrolase